MPCMSQENVTNSFAALASYKGKGFASIEEFELRAKAFKRNLERLQVLNANITDYYVSYIHYDWLPPYCWRLPWLRV